MTFNMTFKWLWSYMKKFKHKFILALILVAICSFLSLVTPYLSGIIVDEVIKKNHRQLLLKLVFIIIGVTALRSLLRYTFQIFFERISQNVIYTIRNDMYTKLQQLDFTFYDNNETGDIMNKMTGDINAIRHFMAWVIYMVFENSLIFIFAITLMLTINYKFTLIILSCTPLIAYSAYKLSNEVKPTFEAIRKQYSRLNSRVEENISGNRVVKAFAREDFVIERFTAVNEGFKNENLKSSYVWERHIPIIDFLSGTLSVVMLLVGSILTMKSQISVGTLVTFNSLIFAITGPLRMAGWLINDTRKFQASAEKVIALINEEPKIESKPKQLSTTFSNNSIQFKNVSFKYEDNLVLDNINLTAHLGEKIGIVGPTGSGKSTLTSLICRFYDCSSGNILFDGKDIKSIDLKDLRDNIGVAMQDIFLFSDTIEGNIAFGIPNASIDDVIKAAKLADAHDFIMNLSDGYNTIIGERGVGLSGGQKQRIALARAILKNPSVLILDDTTSSLDVETEFEIQNSLKSYLKNKTTFIITHRLSSVKDMDQIFVLYDGHIIERGSHTELLKLKGYYYNIYTTQYGDFDKNLSREVI